MKKVTVNMVSESDLYPKGHGVHTAYDELSCALEARDDCRVIRGRFGERVTADVIHFHTLGSKTWVKMFQKDAKKIVSAHVVPASLVGSIRGARQWLFLARWYMRWYYNRADKVLAVSSMTRRALIDEVKVNPDRIEVLYNTVDMDSYRPGPTSRADARKRFEIGADERVVVGVGQIQPRKRVDVFVEMARVMPEVKFIWVGGIPFKQLGADYALMQRMIKGRPDNLIITDVVPHEDVIDYLHAADVFCLPAEQENHPMCVLEAAGAGLPIVVRDIAEYDDTFKWDALRCGSDDEFSEAVSSLLTDESVRRQWIEKSGLIRDRFDSAAGADRMMEIYRSLL